MKLRLQGTPAECAKLAFLLRYGPPDLEVVEVSQPYPNRGDSRLVRVYVEARFPEGLPPLERTFYSLTTPDGRPLRTDAWGNEVTSDGRGISDHNSVSAALARVRELAARLDLDHPDPAYQAGKADQLARAATDLAHDLRVLAEGRRLRRHLVEDHCRLELVDRTQNADVWAGDHRDDHHAGVPAGTPHGEDDHERSVT